MKQQKQDNLRSSKIIASSILLAIGVLAFTLALVFREKGYAILPATMSFIGLWFLIKSWTRQSIFQVLIGKIVSFWKHTDSYTERVLPDELKSKKID